MRALNEVFLVARGIKPNPWQQDCQRGATYQPDLAGMVVFNNTHNQLGT